MPQLRRGVLTSWLVVAFLTAAVGSAHAAAFAFSDLLVNTVTVTAANGTIAFAPSNSAVVALAQNSLGEFDLDFSGPAAFVTASAAVTSTHANSNSGVVRSQATSGTLLLSGSDESALSRGQASWVADFSIVCATNVCADTTDVTFSAVMIQQLSVQTDGVGLLSRAEAVFALNLDSSPVLLYDALLTTGPNGLQSQSGLFPLFNTLTLKYGTHYQLAMFVAAETSGQTAVPEPTTLSLFLSAGVAFVFRRRSRSGQRLHPLQ